MKNYLVIITLIIVFALSMTMFYGIAKLKKSIDRDKMEDRRDMTAYVIPQYGNSYFCNITKIENGCVYSAGHSNRITCGNFTIETIK